MTSLQIKNLENRINRLEKLVSLVVQQEDQDWLDNPKIVKKLDLIADKETNISASEAGI